MRKRPTKRPRTIFYQMLNSAIVAAARAVVDYDNDREDALADARWSSAEDEDEGEDTSPPIDWKVVICAPFEESAEETAEETEEYEPSEADDYTPSDSDEDGSTLVSGVPPQHPVHAEIAALLPAFAEVRKIVEAPDFAVTKESIQTAMPVWLSFNGLAKYKGDENFDAIVAFVRSQIKPVCFAAMGKELQESSK